MTERAARFVVALGLAALPAVSPAVAQSVPPTPPVVEELTFDEAVQRALDRNPSVGEAAQEILKAEALLDRARSVFLPNVYGAVGTTILDDARGFGDSIVTPKTQTAFAGTVSYSFLDAARWANKAAVGDTVTTAKAAAAETRQHVAVTAAQAYLAVIAAERQSEITQRTLATAQALEDYAKARLDVGQGSRLNHVRAVQERASAQGLAQLAELAVCQAREALGVAVFAPGPVGAKGEPRLPPARVPGDDTWMDARPDVQVRSSELQSRERVAGDAWKTWLPTVEGSFTPRYVTPAGLFEPSKTWRAIFQLEVPLFDRTLSGDKAFKVAERDAARLRLDALRVEARSELRNAQEAVGRIEGIVLSAREAAEASGEALRISEIAYRAGATTNFELVQAQQAARTGEILAAVAEDRLRQARLDLLVALGQFP